MGSQFPILKLQCYMIRQLHFMSFHKNLYGNKFDASTCRKTKTTNYHTWVTLERRRHGIRSFIYNSLYRYIATVLRKNWETEYNFFRWSNTTNCNLFNTGCVVEWWVGDAHALDRYHMVKCILSCSVSFFSCSQTTLFKTSFIWSCRDGVCIIVILYTRILLCLNLIGLNH